MVVVGAVELDTFGAVLSTLSAGCSNGEGHGVVDVEVSKYMINIFKFQLSLLCPCRTFLASVILASKFWQDKCYSNCACKKKNFLALCMFVYFLILFIFIS